MICRDTSTHGMVCGWLDGSVGQWVGSDQMTKNLISLDLIKIIQFSLKIYDFVDIPPLMVGRVGGWVGQWVGSHQMNNN